MSPALEGRADAVPFGPVGVHRRNQGLLPMASGQGRVWGHERRRPQRRLVEREREVEAGPNLGPSTKTWGFWERALAGHVGATGQRLASWEVLRGSGAGSCL